MGGAKTKGLLAGLRAALRTSGEPGILYHAFTVGLAFTGGKSGDITFGASEGLAVFLFLVIGDESHMHFNLSLLIFRLKVQN